MCPSCYFSATQRFLALDTSTDVLSLGLVESPVSPAPSSGEPQPSIQTWLHAGAGGSQSSATLIPEVLRLLRQAGLDLHQLDALVVGIGPGSFTGLRVRVTVVSPDQIQREVLSGRHELGLGGLDSQAPHDELSIVPLRERRLYLACRAAHPLAGSQPTLKQVLGYPLVTVFMHGRTAKVAAMGDGDAGSADLSRNGFAPAIEVNSLDTAKQVTRRSDALFPGSASMLATDFARGELVRLDFDGPELRTQPALIRMRNRTPSPAALKFMELVREVEAELITQDVAAAPRCVSRT